MCTKELLDEFVDNEGVTMVKLFEKEYYHAYVRGNTVWVQGSTDGKPYHRVSTGKPYGKANMNWVEKNWESIIRDYHQSKLSLAERDGVPTLDEYAALSFVQQRGNRRFYTTDMYKRQYRDFIAPIFGSRKIDEIKVGEIKDWYGYLIEEVNTHKYASNLRTVFSTILSDAMEDEYLDKNVVKNARFPRKDKFRNIGSDEIDPFTLEEVKTLIKNATGQFKNLITYQFFTGTRPGEMIGLKWEDINFESKTIHIQRTRQPVTNPKTESKELGPPKGGESRRVTMLPIVEEALREQFKLTGLKEIGFVFLTIHGKPYMDTDGLRKRQWVNLLKRCLIDDRIFYQTRHTFASIFLSEGEDIAWISKVMLGHTKIETTLRYYAKYIKGREVVRGQFLLDERTNNVQEKSDFFESA